MVSPPFLEGRELEGRRLINKSPKVWGTTGGLEIQHPAEHISQLDSRSTSCYHVETDKEKVKSDVFFGTGQFSSQRRARGQRRSRPAHAKEEK